VIHLVEALVLANPADVEEIRRAHHRVRTAGIVARRPRNAVLSQQLAGVMRLKPRRVAELGRIAKLARQAVEELPQSPISRDEKLGGN
jgi:hypothetical protein